MMTSQENLVAELQDDLAEVYAMTVQLGTFVESIKNTDISLEMADKLERKADTLMTYGQEVYKTLIRNGIITK